MQRQRLATALKPRQSEPWDQPGQRAEDNNACRWEWKFSLVKLDNERVSITDLGRDFLLYLTAANLPEKPG
jgi:hypothetical protein